MEEGGRREDREGGSEGGKDEGRDEGRYGWRERGEGRR